MSANWRLALSTRASLLAEAPVVTESDVFARRGSLTGAKNQVPTNVFRFAAQHAQKERESSALMVLSTALAHSKARPRSFLSGAPSHDSKPVVVMR